MSFIKRNIVQCFIIAPSNGTAHIFRQRLWHRFMTWTIEVCIHSLGGYVPAA
jgi:hypothetical protein